MSTDLFSDTITKESFAEHIKNFNFEDLFIELGWDHFNKELPLSAGNCKYKFQGIVEKRGFTIFQCIPIDGARFPRAAERDKLDRQITHQHNEHLVIYSNPDTGRQLWEYRLKEPNQPDRRRRQEYYTHQDPEVLFHKLEGLFFTIDEEEQISIIDVKKRVAEQFDQNYEQVTKKFYKKFKKEHKAFKGFIEGITEKGDDKDWYASLMLNRLMFIYFIQKKGFLDNDRDYLWNKLKQVQEEEGENEFYGFYTDFLTVLFHKGLGHPDRTEELEEKLGKVPYLNGGLFDVHKLETKHPDLKIKDDAFERLFEFFDEYNWYLDNRKKATGEDINPDVIGYIFEKYINDRADMGAYYTQEDITDYISKNSIIPWLFYEMKDFYSQPFSSGGEVWAKLQESGDTYIYDAVKTGIEEAGGENADSIEELDIPRNIAKGLDTDASNLLERREDWNTETPDRFALPTEIWRETIERWQRYFGIRNKIENGELSSVNDLISYNLDIKQFAQDLMENTDDPELVKACWKSLTKVTVLDPTCGSGAFLFAALNVMEPLYEACIQKMEAFIDEHGKQKFAFFSDELDKIRAPEHPNHEYFIYKSIILNNLYGVDIMHEAVEIAKLRLFLKLVATVDVDYDKENLGLEPLPDIDFNIRSGNTLVGYATKNEFEQMASGKLDFDNDKQAVLDQADLVNKVYQRFKEKQLREDYSSTSYKQAKEEVNNRLAELNERLNQYLATNYLPANYKEEAYQEWLNSHQPFHWFAEFYTIIEEQGGFDVIVGNPPYVKYRKVKNKYTLRGFDSIDCGDLYAFVMERAVKISHIDSKVGLIIPLSGFTLDGFKPIQDLYFKNFNSLHISNWSGDAHPSKLFQGVNKRLQIVLGSKSEFKKEKESSVFVTKYIKWYSDERPILFETKPSYQVIDIKTDPYFNTSIPKISSTLERRILSKIKRFNSVAQIESNSNTEQKIYYTRKVSFFLQFLDFIPIVKNSDGDRREPSELKKLNFDSEKERNKVLASLTSSLFYWYYIINADCRNLNKREVVSFKVPEISDEKHCQVKNLLETLMKSYHDNSELKTINYTKKGEVTVQYFNFRASKNIIDKIDTILAPNYDLTTEELDFIINYEIKYRMGDELVEE